MSATRTVGVLVIHGMGDQRPDFSRKFERKLQSLLPQGVAALVEPIYYQAVLAPLETEVAQSLEQVPLREKRLRRFVLGYLGDAASYEHRPERSDSAYMRVSAVVHDSVQRLKARLGAAGASGGAAAGGAGGGIAVVAHSLGCHVIANYIYDAQVAIRFWQGRPGDTLDRLQSVRLFVTVGCNIAVFVAGLRDIAPFARPNAGFEWYNYYDKDDLLGYPLRPLTRAGKRPYEGLVTGDIAVRAGFGPLGSHLNYLERGRVVAAIASRIGRLALSGSVDAG